MRDNKRGRRRISIKALVRRTIALVLMLTFFVPSKAYALSTAISYGRSLFGGDNQQQDEPIVNEDANAREAAGEAAKNSLALVGDETKKVRLKTAKTIAIATSERIEAYDMQIDAKTAKMQSAVRSLREKERSMQTVRWSPLLSIKFPTKPNEEEAFEFQFKPVQLQNEITMLKHKIKEAEMDIDEKVSVTYISIISAQNEINVLEERRRKLQATVAKLQVKVDDGTAAVEKGEMEIDEEGNEVAVSPRVLKARLKKAQERLETGQKRLAACETELANAKTTFEESKKKLSDQMGFDVTTGYTFEDAFVTADLNRDVIEYLYAYAHDDDANVYEAQMNYDEALLTLRVNYELMKGRYSRDIGKLEPFIQQSLDGEKINKKAFKKAYDQFLKDIDADWQGSYKIWFIRIPKEWLKGEIDGIRYVQDDPYVLYSAALDFESANKELINAENDLRNQIYEEYSNYASSRKAYMNANKAYVLAEKQLGIDEINYLMGELSAEEFETKESEYQTLKDDAANALKEFSDTLYSYDRTTCGGLTKFLDGAAQDKQDEVLSLVPVIRRGCIYTIRPIIDSEEFILSIDVPDDFEAETGINVTHFELYVDGHKIGEKTPVGGTIRHLMLSVKEVVDCCIRVYDGETFIDECRIEPTVFSGPLNITIGYEDDLDLHTLGTYNASDEVATNMLVLTLNLDQQEVRNEYENGNDAAYYRLCVAEDGYLLSDRLIPVDQQFTYMSFIKGDLENVFIELFDQNMDEIGIAKFDTKRGEVYNDIDEDAAAALAEKKRQQAIERAAAEEEEAAKLAEQEKREAATELLKALGYPTDNASILYAMKHMNQMGYSLELMNAISSLKEEHEKDQKKYDQLIKDPKADPEELKQLQDRLRITDKMPGIYEKTMTDEEQLMKKEMEEHKKLYIKQLVAEYAKNYNDIKNETAKDVGACQTRMAEIEKEVKEYGSDAIDVFKKDVIPFEESLAKLNTYVAADFIDENRMAAYDSDYNVCNGKITILEGKDYGTSFEPRLKKAVYKGFLVGKTNMNGRDPKNPPTMYDLTDAEFKIVETLNASMTKLQGYMSGSEYLTEAAETIEQIQEYYKALETVEEARKRRIEEQSTQLETYFKWIMPQDECSKHTTDAQNKYNQLLKDITSQEKKVKDAKENLDNAKKSKKLKSKVKDYEQAYNDEVAKLDALKSQKLTYQAANDSYTKYEKDYANKSKDLIESAKANIDEIIKLHGTPKYTKADIDKKAKETGQARINTLNAELTSVYNSLPAAKQAVTNAKADFKTAEKDASAQRKVEMVELTALMKIKEQMDELRFQPKERKKLQPDYDKQYAAWEAEKTKLDELYADCDAKEEAVAAAKKAVEDIVANGNSIIDNIELLGGKSTYTKTQLATAATN